MVAVIEREDPSVSCSYGADGSWSSRWLKDTIASSAGAEGAQRQESGMPPRPSHTVTPFPRFAQYVHVAIRFLPVDGIVTGLIASTKRAEFNRLQA